MPAPDGKTPYDFIYDKVLVTSDRNDINFDIAPAIIEMNLFEHLWDTHMTGTVLLADTADLFQSIKFRGTEKLEIEISYPNNPAKKAYKKKFVITNIESQKKGNDNAAVILFDIIEEHFYISKIEKINKAFDGKPSEIIKKIVEDSKLQKEIITISQEVQSPFRYIIPWLTPLQAIDYVLDKATTERGHPYFLFSPINQEDKLIYKSLKDILEKPPISYDEFIYSQMHTGKQEGSVSDPRLTPGEVTSINRMSLDQKGKTIENYQHWNVYDLLSRVQDGSIGAKYDIRDGNQFSNHEYHLGYDEALSTIKDYLPRNQKRLTFDEKSFGGIHSKNSARFYKTYLSTIYSDGMANPFDLEMEINEKRTSISFALKNNMRFDNIDIQVPGYLFFDNPGNIGVEDSRSIGRKIKLLFMNNDVEYDPYNPDKFIDKKLSGEYFITAARHSFGLTKYKVSLTCTKYAERNE